MKLKWIVFLWNILPSLLWADSGLDDYQMGKFREAASLLNEEDAKANTYLGEMFLYGYGVARHPQKAMQYYQNAALKGDLIAQQIMARYALWIEKSPENALNWFKKAAEQQDVDAMVFCAAAFRQGFGASRSLDLATHYTIEAAKRGNARAQYDLAIHFYGTGDKHLGDLWFKKALKQGDEKALVMQAKHLHTEKEYAKAQDVLARALQKNSPMGYLTQANWFLEKNDLTQAHAYLLKAAKKAYPKAQWALGKFYLQEHTPYYQPDYGFSWIWYAAQQGEQQALEDLKKGSWSPSQIQKMKELEHIDLKVMAFKRLAQILTTYQDSTLAHTPYRLKGIWSDWQNKDALEEGRENAYPKFFHLTTKALFKPHLQPVKPWDISTQAYIEAIMALQKPIGAYEGPFPTYLKDLPVKPSTVLHQQAHLGVATAQFQLAACYQLGRGVEKNLSQARFWYERAMAQDDLRAEYQLAMMDIDSGEPDLILQGRHYLRDAAFKGDAYAAFTLGIMTESKNSKESQNMLMIAAINGDAHAEYRLAQHLSRQSMAGMSALEKKERHALLTELYQKAFQKGIQEAALPLAFYQAESESEKNRQWAIKTALGFATRGYPEGALLLGLMLQKNPQEKRNEHAAKQWFQQAKTHPIGAFIWSSYVTDTDEKQALLESAASGSFPPALLNLAILKHLQAQSPIALLQKGKDLNDMAAKHLLVNLLVLKDKPETLQKAREMLAEMDDAMAQWKLGYLMIYGLGGSLDVESGKMALEKAAQKEPIAQLLMGYAYHMGRFTGQPDEENAKYWFAKAASVLPKASIALGYIYEMVDKNYSSALLAYERVREQESVLANYNMALMYEYGKGVEPNYFKATRYFLAAAESGSAAAMFKLAHIYQHRGYSMTANDYLHQAAMHGYRPAIAALAWRDYE